MTAPNTEQQPSGKQVVYYMPPQETYEDDEINLMDYWRVLVRYKWLIFSAAVLCTGIATAAALVMTPVYRAEVVMAPADEEKGGGLAALAGQFGGLASLAGINLGGGGGGKTEQALATLRSRGFTSAFIKDEGLMPILFQDKWDAAKNTWMAMDPKGIPTEWDAYKTFNSIRSISDDKKTGMLTLSVEWKDPEQAAAWANKLVARINLNQKQEAIKEAEKSIAYLKQQLLQTSVVEMQQAIYRLIEAQTKGIMLANVRDQFAFKVIDPAVVPEERAKPKRKLMVVLGFMVGLMMGVFLAFFLSFINNQREQADTDADKPA